MRNSGNELKKLFQCILIPQNAGSGMVSINDLTYLW